MRVAQGRKQGGLGTRRACSCAVWSRDSFERNRGADPGYLTSPHLSVAAETEQLTDLVPRDRERHGARLGQATCTCCELSTGRGQAPSRLLPLASTATRSSC